MKKPPFIEQLTQTECGLCSCLSILKYYGSKETLLDIRNCLENGRDGLSLDRLKSMMIQKGMSATVYRVKKFAALSKVSLPCIAFWNNDHYIVVYRMTDKMIHIMNPGLGYQKYTHEEFQEHFSDVVMAVVPGETYKPEKRKSPSPWRYVFSVQKSNLKNIILALLFAVVSYLIMLKVPDLTTKIIDEAMTLDQTSNQLRFVGIMAALALIYFVAVLARSISVVSSNVVFCKKIEKQTFFHLLKLPFKFFDMRSSGDILHRVASLSGFRELFTSQIVAGLVDIGAAGFILYFLIQKSVDLTLITLLLSLINVLFLLSTRKPIARSINDEVAEQAAMQAVQNESLFTISSIKTSGMEDQIFDTWSKHMEKVITCYKRRNHLSNLYSAMTNTFQIIAPIAILMIGMTQYLTGEMTMGEVVAFQTMASMLFSSEVSIFGSYTQFLLANTFLNRVNDIWHEKEEERYKSTREINISGHVDIVDLCFSYEKNSSQVLHHINISVKAGQRIALVGQSGSGKSTLGKLISGLYETERGGIFFDGINVKEIKKSSLCKQVGVVPQDVYLLNRSIKDNIIMNNTDTTDEEIMRTCKAARIYDEIEAMPLGLSTIVSELGLNMSGGQRQRIALAKALVHKPKIIVLDEATSALDTINEKDITEYLRDIGCTQIIIAHRLSTIIDSDVIYVLNDGFVTEQGTHEELMEKGGEYYSLYFKEGKNEVQAGEKDERIQNKNVALGQNCGEVEKGAIEGYNVENQRIDSFSRPMFHIVPPYGNRRIMDHYLGPRIHVIPPYNNHRIKRTRFKTGQNSLSKL